jgi:two-component system LytT family response regulator
MKFKYVIVDDEPLARKLIQSHASKVEVLEEAAVCSNAVEAANILRKLNADLLFLDIQMPELTGLDFIKSLKNPPAIIFTTAYREFASDAFDLDAIDYLIKPISFDRFLKAVNKFIASKENQQSSQPISISTSIHIKADRKIFPLQITDITHIESLDNYVKIYLKDRWLVTHENISSLEKRLPPTEFVRIHRSYLVNASHVKSVSSESVFLANTELPFGRAYKQLALIQLRINLKQ